MARLYKGLQGLVKGRGIEVVAGEGRLASPTSVQVGDTTYTGQHVLLATGSEAKSLPGLEVDGDRVLVQRPRAASSTGCPARSIDPRWRRHRGASSPSVWKSFGAEVTIVEALPHLVPLEDEACSKLLERAFRRRGITSKLGARFAGVENTDQGVRVSLENGKTIEAEMLLVAVGRGPVSAGLGYEEVGVEVDRGFVKVDAYCQTNIPTISAVGDLIATPQLAHVGFGEGILVAERLAGLPVVPIDYAGVPRVTYSQPEVASVGLTEAQAVEKYGAERVKTPPTTSPATARARSCRRPAR